jgi:hypothetical protein
MPGDGPGQTLLLERGGNDRSICDGALEADGPTRGNRDQLAIFSLLFPHTMKRLPILLDVQAKA